jgi:HlyD family secretion protein
VDGIVISRNVDVGQTVAASMNAPVLFMIANDLANMEIDANVSEADVGAVEVGQSVTFTVDAFQGRTFNGKVAQIRNAPITVQNVVTYDTVISVNNADLKLKPGMTATVSIITASRTNVCKLRNSALRFKPQERPPTQTLMARWLGAVGLGKSPAPAIAPTNAPAIAKTSTNQVPAGESAALSVDDPPEELARRARELRQRGERVPPEISAKLRELYASGVIQRPTDGGSRGGGAGETRPHPSTGAWQTVYLLTTNRPAGGATIVAPTAARVRTGISDGTFTEITEGLTEGDTVILSVKQATSATPAMAGQSPFGGPGGGPGGRRF